MRLVIFGLVCFWSGVAALIAHLFGWPVFPLMVLIGSFSAVVSLLFFSMCRAAATRFPEDDRIELQSYFGGTFRAKKPAGGVKISH